MIFDNDMAIDDWAALLYLLHHPEADVKAITISASGESRCEPALRNTLSLLDLPGGVPEIPVACGDDYPLDGYFVFPEPWRKDSDTLSGVELPASKRRASSQHAVEVIHQTLQSAEEDVTIVATGPLTNIAQWLERYPEDAKRVAALIIMGGTVDAPGNIIVPNFTDGHPNTTAEWNIYIDPVAADRVLAADIPTVLVGLDVTNAVRVTEMVAKQFKAVAATDSARFWSQVLDRNDWFIASGEYYFWDTLAALIAVDSSLCQGDKKALGVAIAVTDDPWWPTSDKVMPARRWDGQARSHLDATSAGTLVENDQYPRVTVCRETNPGTVFYEFRVRLNSSRR
ncbi:nucleoside hydrolase [Marinimicrobium agarilyticum]|uniref:nucleoside hydrolase n=1 Tax=Marinimicrobium agarilyticum TaxID=306546 RepID=UPI000429B03C|nr:nucleoside hydrolase [Marinimicrobium agarilyticum]